MQRVQAARSPECAKNRQTHKPFLLLEIFISGVGGRAGACPNQVEYDPIAALPTPSPRGLSWPCPGELVRPAPHSPVGTRWQPLPPSLTLPRLHRWCACDPPTLSSEHKAKLSSESASTTGDPVAGLARSRARSPGHPGPEPGLRGPLPAAHTLCGSTYVRGHVPTRPLPLGHGV